MPVPVGVFCLGLCPQICHQVEFINCDSLPTLVLPGVRLGCGEKTLKKTLKVTEGDGRRPSCRHHREPFISPRPQLARPAVNNSDVCSKAGLKLAKLV